MGSTLPFTIRGQGPLPHVLSDPLPHGLLEPLTVGAGLAREGQVLTPEQYEWVPTRTTKPALMGSMPAIEHSRAGPAPTVSGFFRG